MSFIQSENQTCYFRSRLPFSMSKHKLGRRMGRNGYVPNVEKQSEREPDREEVVLYGKNWTIWKNHLIFLFWFFVSLLFWFRSHWLLLKLFTQAHTRKHTCASKRNWRTGRGVVLHSHIITIHWQLVDLTFRHNYKKTQIDCCTANQFDWQFVDRVIDATPNHFNRSKSNNFSSNSPRATVDFKSNIRFSYETWIKKETETEEAATQQKQKINCKWIRVSIEQFEIVIKSNRGREKTTKSKQFHSDWFARAFQIFDTKNRMV